MNNSFTAFAQYVAANAGNSKMNFHWITTFFQCHPCEIDYNIITHLEEGFKTKVQKTAHVLSLFAPWSDPVNLKRMWWWVPLAHYASALISVCCGSFIKVIYNIG